MHFCRDLTSGDGQISLHLNKYELRRIINSKFLDYSSTLISDFGIHDDRLINVIMRHIQALVELYLTPIPLCIIIFQ